MEILEETEARMCIRRRQRKAAAFDLSSSPAGLLSGRLPAGSGLPSSVQECLPARRQLAHTAGDDEMGWRPLWAWACKRSHLLVCGRVRAVL